MPSTVIESTQKGESYTWHLSPEVQALIRRHFKDSVRTRGVRRQESKGTFRKGVVEQYIKGEESGGIGGRKQRGGKIEDLWSDALQWQDGPMAPGGPLQLWCNLSLWCKMNRRKDLDSKGLGVLTTTQQTSSQWSEGELLSCIGKNCGR